MVGGFAVGKTSLVRRLVSGIFSEKYLTTIGVKIDQKQLFVKEQAVLLVLWDLYGDDDYQKVRASYLQGSAGYILVIDGTRPETVDVAIQLQKIACRTVGNVPFALLLNKQDLEEEWGVNDSMLAELSRQACLVTKVSAKTGEGVELAFAKLAEAMVAPAS